MGRPTFGAGAAQPLAQTSGLICCVGFANREAARALGEVGPAALGWFKSCQEEEEEEEDEEEEEQQYQ